MAEQKINMPISLVGMSGSGKSLWAKRLAEMGWKNYCVDDLIEEKLEPELKALGFSGIADVARWLGQPWGKQYNENQKKYLSFEKEVMKKILGTMMTPNSFRLPLVLQGKGKTNIVIDTTGSVIYTGTKILNQLKTKTKIIYLATPPAVQNKMLSLYLKDLKPVIWGKKFNQSPDETNRVALERCYPKLLKFRSNVDNRHLNKHLIELLCSLYLLL